MKKTMWKWKAVLTLLICMAAVSGNWSGCKVQAYVTDEIYWDEETGFNYRYLDDGGIEITGYRCRGTETEITIPEKIDGREVVTIFRPDEYFFFDDSGLSLTHNDQPIPITSITIPKSVKEIAVSSTPFFECDKLEKITVAEENKNYTSRDTSGNECNAIITKDGKELLFGCKTTTIPDGVTSIGKYAFEDCSSLTSIKIPDGVMKIGDCAFYDCKNLTDITIPKSLTSVGSEAFYNTQWLKAREEEAESKGVPYVLIENNILIEWSEETDDVQIPPNVAHIEGGVFSNWRELTSITIPKGVKSIGGGAFSSCYELTSIQFESNSSLTNIGYRAFSGCSSLTSIEIPDGVTSIGEYAFYDCSKLTSITIPKRVTSIGEEAFWGCDKLTSITIPKEVTSIGGGAFEFCYELASIQFEPDSSLTSIGNSAFYDCESLTNITIPDSVRSIGNYAFDGCESLTSITIPDSVRSIGYWAFDGRSENLVIRTPSGSYAEKYANDNHIKLDIITENSTPTTPGGTTQNTKPDTKPVTTPTTEAPAQTNVPAAKKTPLTAEKEKAKVKVTSSDAKNPTVEYVESTNKSAKTVKVPDSVTVGGVTYKVTSVKDKAFKGNKKVTSVTIGKNVTSIGKDAFKSCAKLKTVKVESDKLTKIGDGAFNGDKKLTKVTLGKGVTSIGKEAFKNCTALKSVTVKSTKLKTIGANAFYGDKKLTIITLKTTKLTKKSIGKNALKGTNKKLKIKVPKKQVKSYKKYFKGKGNKSVKLTK